MYTIKRAAEITGVPAATLRAWERRYGVVAPVRTDSGYRLYDDDCLAEIGAMHELVEAGWTASQAAEEVRRRHYRAESEAALGGAGGQHGQSDALVEAFVAAAEAMDNRRVAEVLDEAFSRTSFESVVDHWLMPALDRLGRAWAGGSTTVASEHLASHAVLRRLSAAYEAAAQPTSGHRVVVGLAGGSRHELGALAFAVAARRCGLAVLYVGADLPVDSWLDAVSRDRAAAAVIAVPTAQDQQAVTDTAIALHRADPELPVFVGGGAQATIPPPAWPLGHQIGPASRQLMTRLAARRNPREEAR